VDVTEWEPATDVEVAMRDALRTDDQESYFRIVAGLDLLLPVTADALAGLAPLGWGTWSTGGRTHVLAFTSPAALQACLAEYTGSARRIPYAELADTWPNLEWWLAINPGLPIEGYLPAWFVAQLARGDLRLPPHGPSRDATAADPAASAGAAGPAEDHDAASPVPSSSAVADAPTAQGAAVPGGGLAGGAPAAAQRPATVAAADGAAADRPPVRTTGGGLPMRTPGVAAADLAARYLPAPPAAPAPAAADLGAPPPAAPGPGLAPVATRPRDAGHPPAATAPPAGYPQAAVPAGTGPAQPNAPAPGGPLPRRPLMPPSERPTSMAAAAQAFAGTRQPQVVPDAAAAPGPAGWASPLPAAAGLAPPVIPGPSSGEQSSSRTPFGPAEPGAARPLAPRPVRPAGGAPAGPPTFEPRQTSATFGPRSSGDSRYVVDPDEEFRPANEVEQDLQSAADSGSTDLFLSTLLLATVLVPVGEHSRPGAQPGDPGFVFRTENNDGDRYLVVFTSPDRLEDHYPEPVRTIGVRFHHLISNWPDESWAFAVNPGSPVGAKLPGAQIVALANWAAEAGLGADDHGPAEPVRVPAATPAPRATGDGAARATVMQKTIPPEQVDYFLDRGYDRVSGFVHRADEIAHLRTPADLYAALGLGYAGSPYQPDAKEAYLLRWAAYRPSLYRIPYGGQTDQALRAMDGWVIERAPFRGNGFAPGEGRDVIAEFKVDSARLPHGTQLLRVDAHGEQQLIAIFDCDTLTWLRVGER
jgi:hypothetical protein